MCGGCDPGYDVDESSKVNDCSEDCGGVCTINADPFCGVVITNCPNGKDANTCSCLVTEN